MLEPEFLSTLEADVPLVADLIALRAAIPGKTLETARQVVRKVVDDLMHRLEHNTRETLRGALNRSQRTRPRHADIDWPRTIGANLRHYQPRTIVAGAPQHSFGVFNTYQGAVYIFEQNSSGSWIQKQELTASDGAAGHLFGSSVAISGSTVAVGAPGHGAAYVFVESGGTWSQQAKLTASDGAAEDEFGSSVAVVGNTVVVGAPCHPDPSPYCGVVIGGGPGAAYVFAQVSTSWIQQAELTASDGVAGDLFGASIAAQGSTMVIGAPLATLCRLDWRVTPTVRVVLERPTCSRKTVERGVSRRN